MKEPAIHSGWTRAGHRRIWVRVPDALREEAAANGDGARPGLNGRPSPYWKRPLGLDNGSTLPSPAIVLVHGIGFSGRGMEPLLRALAPRRTVFAPDLPGFGRSDPPPHNQDVPELAEELRRWLLENRIAPVALVAASFGCQVAIDLAANHPALVEKLILVGPTIDPAGRSGRRYAARWARNAVRASPFNAPVAVKDVLDAGPWRAARTMRRAFSDDVEPKLERIEAPTLVIRGERDRIVAPGWTDSLIARIGEAESVSVRTAHLPGPRSAAAVAKLIEEFVARGPVAQRRWIVDGMNVIGSNPDGWWRDRPRAWRRLRRRLEGHTRASGQGVTLVLDGRRPRGWDEEGSPVETAFASGGRGAADDAIVARVAADPRPELVAVATSDRELAARVREHGATVVPARRFLELLAGSG